MAYTSLDFFDWQEESRKKSGILSVIFFVVVFSWGIMFYTGLLYIVSIQHRNQHAGPYDSFLIYPYFSFNVCMIVSILCCVVFIVYSLIEIGKIKKGGTTFIATSLKAVPMTLEKGGGNYSLPETETYFSRARMLQNVVEEIAIASQMPCPDIYILPNQYSINAMAAGPFDDDGAIIITIGALKKLTREEMQGLIAHEMSHLANGDGIFFAAMSGWLSGLMTVWTCGLKVMESSRGRALLIGLLLLISGSIANFMAKIVQVAYSRQREYLADARAIEFSRSKEGLSSVLKKIGGLQHGGRIKSPQVAVYRHFFIAQPEKSFIFSSHPPLDERIFILDPSWDGFYYDFNARPVDFLYEAPDPAVTLFSGNAIFPMEPIEESFPAIEPVESGSSAIGDPALENQFAAPSPAAVPTAYPAGMAPPLIGLPFLIAFPLIPASKAPVKCPDSLKTGDNSPPRARHYLRAKKRALKISRNIERMALEHGKNTFNAGR
ncbi:MAG: M48 family metalloprotease [Deltaproteobacteria bacterium]|jgi:Zn-dependent protease with chaperone function|nr:M48 family metalloprotease [Deltaproteobacteria bacterium]